LYCHSCGPSEEREYLPVGKITGAKETDKDFPPNDAIGVVSCAGCPGETKPAIGRIGKAGDVVFVAVQAL
jgi:hypothetical protein